MPLDAWQNLDTNQPVNWSHSLNRGRVAWWLTTPLQYGSNDWYDLVRGYAGVFNSFSSPYGWNTASNPNGAGSVYTDGSAAYVKATVSPYLIGANLAVTNFTVACWVLVPSVPTNGIWSVSGGSGTSIFFSSATGNSNKWTVSRGGGAILASSLSAAVANAWVRVVFTQTVSPAQSLLYINGVPQTAGSSSSLAANNCGSAYIGMGAGLNNAGAVGNGYAKCQIQDFSAWNRVLSAQEVLADYWLSQQGYPDVLNYEESPAVTIFVPGGTPANVSIAPVELGWNTPPATASGNAGVAAAVVETAWATPPVNVTTGTNVSVSLAPVEFAWLTPPVTASGNAGVNVSVTDLGWLTPPVVVTTGTNASVSLSPVEMGWLTPPATASGSTGFILNARPAAFAWTTPPASATSSVNVSPLSPKELAWLAPPVGASAGGAAIVNLTPVEMGWLAPPVGVSAGASIVANVVSLAFNQVGAQASASLSQVYVFPCEFAFAKVSAGFVGQPPVPEIVFIALPT